MQSNRRQFLYRAGTLSAGLTLLPPVLNSYARGNYKPLPASDMINSEANFHHACELVINVKVPEGVDWDMWLGPAPRVPFRGVLHGNWRFISDYSGGQLTDWAGHHIDIANRGLGLENTGPVTIEGKGRANNDGIYDVPVEYDFTCVYVNGLLQRPYRGPWQFPGDPE